jgi:hypothetical protein
MHLRSTQLLIAALAYATFADKDVETGARELVQQLDVDLNEAGFEPSSDTEEAENVLEEALNSVDDRSERLDAAIANAEPTEEELDDEPGVNA